MENKHSLQIEIWESDWQRLHRGFEIGYVEYGRLLSNTIWPLMPTCQRKNHQENRVISIHGAFVGKGQPLQTQRAIARITY